MQHKGYDTRINYTRNYHLMQCIKINRLHKDYFSSHLNHVVILMRAAALGLTCKDALVVFSHSETLNLQKRVTELEQELKRCKIRYLQQLQRIEWAVDTLRKYGVQCGCIEYCPECDNSFCPCTCRIATCQCRECYEFHNERANDLIDAGLLPVWFHPKGHALVAVDPSELDPRLDPRLAPKEMGDPDDDYLVSMEFNDPNWMFTHNMARHMTNDRKIYNFTSARGRVFSSGTGEGEDDKMQAKDFVIEFP